MNNKEMNEAIANGRTCATCDHWSRYAPVCTKPNIQDSGEYTSEIHTCWHWKERGKIDMILSYDFDIPAFKTDNHDQLVAMMNKYGPDHRTAVGNNESSERVAVEILPEKITIMTWQKNGWLRTDVYWRDGTIDELYHKEPKNPQETAT